MRKNIYKWHRTLSLIIAIPVFLWAASGFMHPVMTNIRPKVGTQVLQPTAIDTSVMQVTLLEALQKNNIASIANVRIVQMGGNQFYQLQLPGKPVLQYISTQNGRLLKNGDDLYARYLAKKFLSGEAKPAPLLASLDRHALRMEQPAAEHDCCTSTAAAIMFDTSGAFVSNVELTEAFTGEYKYINRLLPVYKVSFNRADGIRIYVETGQDRFAFAMDNKRAVFDRIFTLFHTLGWLDVLGDGKHVVAIALTAMAFITTLLGIYIFCITKTKKANGNEIVKARRNHRWTSLIISLFTLMFTGSGAFHAFKKLSPTDEVYFNKQVFASPEIQLDMRRLQQAVPGIITNISLVKMGAAVYWQVYNQSLPSSPVYLHTGTYTEIKNGDVVYAQDLAGMYSHHLTAAIKNTERIAKFTQEYGFVNKRLPVWKINYDSNAHERFYIETSTGKVAAHINDNDMLEGYSFAMFHKHEFMALAGKPVKDFSTMFWAMAQIAGVVVGLILYFKIKRRERKSTV